MNLSVSTTRPIDVSTGAPGHPAIYHLALLDDDGQIHVYSKGRWVRTNAEPANVSSVTINQAGVWCLATTGRIYRWNDDPDHSVWNKDTVAKNVVAMSSDAEGLWCINQNGEVFNNPIKSGGLGAIYHWMLGGWQKMDSATTTFLNGGIWEYKVKPQDGLLKIVRAKYKVTDEAVVSRIADEIMRLNKLSNRDRIEVNQVLNMPSLSYR
jgi:hypothetical protein